MTKLKSRYVSCENYNHCAPTCFEHIVGASMTVQGESYTVQELFDRYMNGQVVNVERPSFWDDTSDFDSIDFQALKNADPFEKQQMLEDVQAKAKRAAEALSKWKKEQEADKGSDSSSSNEDSSKSSKPKKQGQSDKRGAEDAQSERSERKADEAAERKQS